MNALSEHSVMKVEPWWKIWKNPLIIRYIRSRLRVRRALGWILGILILSSFLFFTIYLTSINRDLASPRDAARGILIPLFIIQGILLMLMGTGSVASGLVQDKIAGTLDYQRLTPMSPLAKIIGYLFGLPIREYLLFAITLPYTIFGLWVGQIPFSVYAPVYGIFFMSVILYHLTGMAAGMIARRWRFTARLTQGLVVLLYLVLPQFSHLGLYAFQFLTVRPVVAAKLLPMIPSAFTGGGNNIFNGIQSVPFFNWEFSSFGFSVILQGLLIVTLGLMSYRKWRDQNQHALGKCYGMGVFVAIAVMILGNLWPFLTRASTISLPIFGAFSYERIDEGVAVALPLILTFSLLFVGMWVLTMVTPSHHEVLRGWRRVVKFDYGRLFWWRDESPSGIVLAVICVVACLTIGLEIYLLSQHQFYKDSSISFMNRIYLPLASVVAICSFYASLISLENRRIFVVLLLWWGLPALLAIFIGAAFSSYKLSIYLSALSPVFLIIYGAGYLSPSAAFSGDADEYFAIAKNAYWLGLVLQILLTTWLMIRWRMLLSRLVRIAKTGSTSIPASLMEDDGD
jgi:hypothetical protein